MPFAMHPSQRDPRHRLLGWPPHFVEPRLVGEFEFAEWTQAGDLRAPSFKGLREDKDPRQVVREVAE